VDFVYHTCSADFSRICTSDGLVHTVDNDGENVIYDHAFNQLFEMEAQVLVSATQFIAAGRKSQKSACY